LAGFPVVLKIWLEIAIDGGRRRCSLKVWIDNVLRINNRLQGAAIFV
jgi:hypothetical protein